MHDAIRAYIAGFLDGDGSIIFQLVRRCDYLYGFQIRASVCFYQSTRSRAGLEWLKQQLGCGYIRNRAGSMSDLTIVGWSAVRQVLELVQPFTIFKREQVDRALDILTRLDDKLTPREFVEVANEGRCIRNPKLLQTQAVGRAMRPGTAGEQGSPGPCND